MVRPVRPQLWKFRVCPGSYALCLALFRRRPPEHVEASSLPASENLYNSRLSPSVPQNRRSRPDAALVEITKFQKLSRTADASYRQRMIEDSIWESSVA